MAKGSVFDKISKGFADAIADVREKVVEEPWYGRVVNEPELTAPLWSQPSQEQAIGSVEHSIERNAPDMDMDR